MGAKALLCTTLATSAIVGFAGTASAEGGYDDHYDHRGGTFYLGAAFNYGIWTGPDSFKQLDGDVNPFGAAIGVTAGVTLPPGVYLGADFNYYWGESRTISGVNAAVSAHANIYDVLGDVGYDFWIHRTGVLRPKIGLGIGVARGTFCGSVLYSAGACATDSHTGFTIAPGVEYLHYFGPAYLSLEAKYEEVMLDGPNPSAVVLGIGLGAAL